MKEQSIFQIQEYMPQRRQGMQTTQSVHEAMHRDHQEQYLEAMKIEVASVHQQITWKTTPRSEAGHALKSTWLFKLKLLPYGTPSKFKARFCVRGDLQKEGMCSFETYAPVCQWSTVRMILTMVLQNGWATKQVNYTNVFDQAEMKETVYIEAPKLFGPKSGRDLVPLLLKSLHGLKQAPITFYEKRRYGLLERGFTQSEIDPCLFMKKDCIALSTWMTPYLLGQTCCYWKGKSNLLESKKINAITLCF
jgi:hypothetical protein